MAKKQVVQKVNSTGEETRSYPLLKALIIRSRLPWFWATALVAGVLVLLLIPVAYLDGTPTILSEWGFWLPNLNAMVLITYILVAYPLMIRWREGAVKAFQPLLSLDEGGFSRLEAEILRPTRRREWTAVFLGIIFAVITGQPWSLDWTSGYLWQSVYLVITGTIFWCLMGWLIYDTVASVVRISRLSRRSLKLDILDTEMLAPIAVWSLGISLAFVGGISLSLIFSTRESLLAWENITTYTILVCLTLLIFFLSMWGVHGAMTRAKERKLSPTRKRLAEVTQDLDENIAHDRFKETESLTIVTKWVAYFSLINKSSTWPFNADIIRKLLVSTVAPAAVYAVRIFSNLGIQL
jgi:hypothetical protein